MAQKAKQQEKLHGRCSFFRRWTDWPETIHEAEAQIARQGRAMLYPFTFVVNVKRRAARFSSTSALPHYDTTLAKCDCFDFQERQLPCKHIYRLAVELGIIEIIKRSGYSGHNGYDADILKEISGSENVDAHPEQIKRQKSAMGAKYKPLQIDYDAKFAVFSGSGKMPYETTENSCTCRDYFVRRLPCKHIYRLRIELESR